MVLYHHLQCLHSDILSTLKVSFRRQLVGSFPLLRALPIHLLYIQLQPEDSKLGPYLGRSTLT